MLLQQNVNKMCNNSNYSNNNNDNEKTARRDANTALRSKAEPKIFVPPETLFLGTQDGQNLIS